MWPPRSALAAAALLLALAVPSAARDETREPLETTREGWYAGLQVVRGIQNWENDAGLRGDDSGAWGMNARLGWRFQQYWAAEFQYEHTAGYKIRGTEADVFAHQFTLNGKAFYPLDRFQPFALVGVGLMQVDVSGRGTAAEDNGLRASTDGNLVSRMGVGLDVYVTDQVVLTTDAIYVLPAGALNDLQSVSVGWGLQYRFAPFVY